LRSGRKKVKEIKKFVYGIICIFLLPAVCLAATLDTTFNSTGYAVHNNAAGGNGDDQGFAVWTGPFSRILIAGNSYSSLNGQDMAVWAYTATGTLDTLGFGSPNGYITHNNAGGGSQGSSQNDYARGIITNTGGKIYVTGYSIGPDSSDDMVLWRFNGDGSFDTTFNSPKGLTTSSNAAGGTHEPDRGYAIALDSSERPVVVGYGMNASNNYDMVVWRYTTAGTLDTTFNSTGIKVWNNPVALSDDVAYGVTITTAGRIIVVGYTKNNESTANKDMAVWALNSDGTLDITGFNSPNGYVTHSGAAGGSMKDEVAQAVTICDTFGSCWRFNERRGSPGSYNRQQ